MTLRSRPDALGGEGAGAADLASRSKARRTSDSTTRFAPDAAATVDISTPRLLAAARARGLAGERFSAGGTGRTGDGATAEPGASLCRLGCVVPREEAFSPFASRN